MICSVTNRGVMRWKILHGVLNAARLIDFMGRLVKDAPAKVFLILDNLKVHHACPVKAWLAERTEQIEVFHLPGLSPELNPEELLNADLKRAVTTGAPRRSKGALRCALIGCLRRLQKLPERIRRYFEHGPVRYAA